MTPRMLLSAFALPFLAAPLGDELVHSAAEDTELVRTYTWEMDLELDELSMTFNGEQLPEEYRVQMEMVSTLEETIVVRDVYGEPLDGRPASLQRTYETLEGVDTTSGTDLDGEDMGEELELSHALEGRAVLFTWDEDDQEFAVEFDDDGEEDQDLLEDLVEDMDMRGFLPDGEVEEGDTWEVDSAVFDELSGGIDLESGEELDHDELDQLLEDNQDGEVEATYMGTRDEDGVLVGVIWITAELDTSVEQTEELEGTEVDTEMTVGMELEGEVLWDLERGHLFGLALEGTVEMTQSMSGADEFEGESFEFGQEMSFSGNVSISIEVEREE